MALSHEAPLLLTLLLGPLLSFLVWGFWHSRHDDDSAQQNWRFRDDILVGFLVLAAVAVIAFILYTLVT